MVELNLNGKCHDFFEAHTYVFFFSFPYLKQQQQKKDHKDVGCLHQRVSNKRKKGLDLSNQDYSYNFWGFFLTYFFISSDCSIWHRSVGFGCSGNFQPFPQKTSPSPYFTLPLLVARIAAPFADCLKSYANSQEAPLVETESEGGIEEVIDPMPVAATQSALLSFTATSWVPVGLDDGRVFRDRKMTRVLPLLSSLHSQRGKIRYDSEGRCLLGSLSLLLLAYLRGYKASHSVAIRASRHF